MQIIQRIQDRIYEIRDQKVMLDFDLAELYDVETRALNQAVKRNLFRFPDDFMFRLTPGEWEEFSSSQSVMMRNKNSGSENADSSQIVMSSKKHRGKVYLPYAFTEHGVTMLANVLKSRKAVKMSIAIVRVFISLKQMLLDHKDLSQKLEELRKELSERIGKHDVQLSGIYKAIEKLLKKEAIQKNWEDRERIGFRK